MNDFSTNDKLVKRLSFLCEGQLGQDIQRVVIDVDCYEFRTGFYGNHLWGLGFTEPRGSLIKLDPQTPKNPNGYVILCTSTTQVHVFFL